MQRLMNVFEHLLRRIFMNILRVCIITLNKLDINLKMYLKVTKHLLLTYAY